MELHDRPMRTIASQAFGRVFRPIARFIRKHWLAGIVPALAIAYGAGDHNALWDRVSGRAALKQSLDRLASGDGYPVSFIQRSDADFDLLYRFILARTRNRDISAQMFVHRRPMTITRLGGGERVIPTPREFPKTIIVPMESPVLFAYDLSDVLSPGSAYAQATTLHEIDDWIKANRETERLWVTVVGLGLLTIATSIREKTRSSSLNDR
jgi:hypothetical protein